MRICYFGIYNSNFGRNKVYISGLRQNGIEIIECHDDSLGLLKYWRLWKKHRMIIKNGGYDVMIVGYPGHIVVSFAKMISCKPIVFDALCSLYEGEVISRGRYRYNPFMRLWIRLIDLLSAKSADLILVETNHQKEYFIKRFLLEAEKVVCVLTGADEEIFHEDSSVEKREKFTAIFRGKFLPEAGIQYVVQTAKLLENEDIEFLIIGSGRTEEEIKSCIDELKPKNLKWITEHILPNEVRQKMLECHVSLGQFGIHERLERTIPHKAFETLALGLPYITGRTNGISELLTDNVNCLMVNCGDPEDLAEKILLLKNQPQLVRSLAENGKKLYEERLTNKKLARDIIDCVQI
ncbi:MAG: glycosyltransferase [Candidatus Paceibacterota bacterium]|jgi:glycosyltransferase involved in cell wall biosynthesis